MYFAGENRVSTPTATESILPWKRDDDNGSDNGAIQQTEFPSWANNKVKWKKLATLVTIF